MAVEIDPNWEATSEEIIRAVVVLRGVLVRWGRREDKAVAMLLLSDPGDEALRLVAPWVTELDDALESEWEQWPIPWGHMPLERLLERERGWPALAVAAGLSGYGPLAGLEEVASFERWDDTAGRVLVEVVATACGVTRLLKRYPDPPFG